MPTYTRSNLKTSISGRIHNKSGMLVDINTTINDAVREVISGMDLRSMKRKASTAPNLFNDIYQYSWPTDGKGLKVVGLQPQNQVRNSFSQWELVSEEEFDRRKSESSHLLSFSDRDFTRKLLASTSVNERSVVIAPLNSLTSEGTWSAFGDAENLSVDNYQYIKGSAALKFDISSAGGTTAGIENSTLSTFDLTEYASAGSVFVWAWITSATDLTNFILRLGNDSSNYYSMTATATNEGLVFTTGWNLIRFDFSGRSTTGTVTDTTCDYAALYMTKAAGKISETDYRFDHIIAKVGSIHNLIYYSKYAWQSSAGVYKENSTDDTDYLNCDTEEYQLFVEKCVERAANEVREYDDATSADKKFKELKVQYLKQYKSEALPLQDTYHNF